MSEFPIEAQHLWYDIERRDLVKIQEHLTQVLDARSIIHAVQAIGNDDHGTALSLAISRGQVDTVTLLLSYVQPLSLTAAIEEDSKVDIQPYMQGREPRQLGNFQNWWTSWQCRDPVSIALKAFLWTDGHPLQVWCPDVYEPGVAEALLTVIIDDGHLNLSSLHKCDIGRSIWFRAARRGWTMITKRFLDAGFPVDLPASRTGYFPGWTRQAPPLHTSALWNAAHMGCPDTVRLLLERGAKIQHAPFLHKGVSSEFMLRLSAYDRHKFLSNRANPNDPSVATEYDESSVTTNLLCVTSQGLKAEQFLRRVPPRPTPGLGTRKQDFVDASKWSGVILILLQNEADLIGHDLYTRHVEDSKSRIVKPAVLELLECGAVAGAAALLAYPSQRSAVSSTGDCLLHAAVRSMNMEAIELALQNTPEINWKDENGRTALFQCVLSLQGTTDVFKRLIKHGVDTNSSGNNGFTVLNMAAVRKRVDLVHCLLERGTQPDQAVSKLRAHGLRYDGVNNVDLYFNAGETPLLSAINSLNLSYSYVSNAEREDHATSSLKIVRALLAKGANADREGYVNVLQSRSGTDRQRPGNFEAEQHIKCFHPLVLATKVIWCGYQYSQQALARRVEIFFAILEVLGTNIQRTVLESTLSQVCPVKIPGALQSSSYNESSLNTEDRMTFFPMEIIQTLLERGVDLNIRDERGFTILHRACATKLDEDVLFKLLPKLIESGSDIEAKDPFERTPLHIASFTQAAAVAYLLECGANTMTQDMYGFLPLHHACGGRSGWNTECVYLLMQHQPTFLPLLFTKNMESRSPLHLACQRAHGSSLEVLLPLVDLDILNTLEHYDIYGCTPMHIACWNICDDPLRSICSKPRRCTSLRQRDPEGRTALVICVHNRSLTKVKLILQAISQATTSEGVAKFDDVQLRAPRQLPFDGNGVDIAFEGREPETEYSLPSTPLSCHSAVDLNSESKALPHTNLHKREDGPDGEEATNKEEEDTEEPSLFGGLLSDSPSEMVFDGDNPDPFYAHIVDSQPTEINPQNTIDTNSDKASFIPMLHQIRSKDRPITLRERRACLNTKDNYRRTALHYAAEQGNAEILQLLLSEEDIDIGPIKGCCYPSPLDLAVKNGNTFCEGLLRDAHHARSADTMQNGKLDRTHLGSWMTCDQTTRWTEESMNVFRGLRHSSWFTRLRLAVIFLAVAYLMGISRYFGKIDL